jgi:hypothetical protein
MWISSLSLALMVGLGMGDGVGCTDLDFGLVVGQGGEKARLNMNQPVAVT